MAARGMTCPLCRKYASITARGTLYQHKGDIRYLVSSRFAECLASKASPEMAEMMRQNRDAGRHAYRCEDGTWIGGY